MRFSCGRLQLVMIHVRITSSVLIHVTCACTSLPVCLSASVSLQKSLAERTARKRAADSNGLLDRRAVLEGGVDLLGGVSALALALAL